MHLQPYLFFDGCCEEAAEFYRKTLGAEIQMMMRFKENPDLQNASPEDAGCMQPPGSDDKIMHMCMRIGDAEVMASDGMCSGKAAFQGFSLSLSVTDEAEANRIFTALSEGGQVQMPLGKTFFSPLFGMVADRFGVSWMVIVDTPAP